MPVTRNLVGRVIEKHVGGRSKSRHLAVVLSSDRGDFILRIPGGNPYDEPALRALVGKRIEATGDKDGHVLFLRQWKELST